MVEFIYDSNKQSAKARHDVICMIRKGNCQHSNHKYSFPSAKNKTQLNSLFEEDGLKIIQYEGVTSTK